MNYYVVNLCTFMLIVGVDRRSINFLYFGTLYLSASVTSTRIKKTPNIYEIAFKSVYPCTSIRFHDIFWKNQDQVFSWDATKF